MRDKIFIFISFFYILLINYQLVAQDYYKTKTITTSSPTKIDSLSLIPGSVLLFHLNQPLDTSFYKIDYIRSIIEFKNIDTNKIKTVEIKYRQFPIDFSKTYSHKTKILQNDSLPFQSDQYVFKNKQKKNEDLFGLEGFEKSGNFSRGIAVGNSQNMSVASDMNLQLAGMISPEIKLTASITDNNIPIQPDGNTQQLQDFDQVFIKLDHKIFSVTAGDFVIEEKKLNFLQYSKKSQGALINANFIDTISKNNYSVKAGAAIARGNYYRYKFNGIEGNQGPYKLQGANNERYIVVLSGTERVYMDGKILERGETADYIIDYNTAEIIFMPRNIITKDKRFEVEFEYSEQNYSRGILAGGISYNTKKIQSRIDFYSETDMKNQPINPLTEDEKLKMAILGDKVSFATIPTVDSSGFFEDRIMYQLIDSLGFDSVFVYSTNPQLAVYQVTFSLVGQGKGDYILTNTTANGRVYQWVAPINNQSQGLYSPVGIVVTPKKRQVLTAAINYKITKNTLFTSELALSVNDLNTFSNLNSQNNQGYATSFSISDNRLLNKSINPIKLKTNISYQLLNKNFNPIERIRPIEFSRQWSGLNELANMNEHLITTGFILEKNKLGYLKYQLEKMTKSKENDGIRNKIELIIKKEHYSFSGITSYSNTNQNILNTNYLLHNHTLISHFKKFEIGLKELGEKNKLIDSLSQLNLGSFHFQEAAIFINSKDSSKTRYGIEYKIRTDYYADSLEFNPETFAQDLIGEITWIPKQNQRFSLTATWRNLEIKVPNANLLKPEQTAQLRMEYRINALKGFIRLNSFYESTSGLESKREYSYIQVAAGQGVYGWIDYNQNGIKELDEFDIAAFQDQANYLRILLPSTDYIKTYGSRFNLNLHVSPNTKWAKSQSKIMKFVNKFSNNTAFNSHLKTTSNDVMERADPLFYNLADSQLISLNSLIRNSLFFNRSSQQFGAEWNTSINMNKMLMVNGYEARSSQRNELKIRWNINSIWLLETIGLVGNKTAASQFFKNRDYNINLSKMETKLSLQPNRKFRISLQYSYGEKLNQSELNQLAISNELGLFTKISNPERGNIAANFGIINFNYNANQADAIAFEMLEGFKTGTNIKWNLTYNRNLMNNLQLTIMYDGRVPANAKTIHTGNIQLRAFF